MRTPHVPFEFALLDVQDGLIIGEAGNSANRSPNRTWKSSCRESWKNTWAVSRGIIPGNGPQISDEHVINTLTPLECPV
jgi:hypothetical protein